MAADLSGPACPESPSQISLELVRQTKLSPVVRSVRSTFSGLERSFHEASQLPGYAPGTGLEIVGGLFDGLHPEAPRVPR